MKDRCTKIEAIDNLSDYLADAIRLLQQDKSSVNLTTVRSMSQVKSNKKERCAKTEANANLKDTSDYRRNINLLLI